MEPLSQLGQVASFEDLNNLVDDFERALKRHGIMLEKDSQLETVCYSIVDILNKQQNKEIRNLQEDIRKVFTDVLGVWIFLTKVVRLQHHPCFSQFVPHLKLLNQGTVKQNTRLQHCEDVSNKVFELLFALVLLDVTSYVKLAPPEIEDISNPDVLAVIDGRLWGFACKTVYSQSGRTFFDNLKKGVQQIEKSRAEIGCVMVNLRNLIDHEKMWPILNKAAFKKGDIPKFASYRHPEITVTPKIYSAVLKKRNQIVDELGVGNVFQLFKGKKAIPGFLAFAQTTTGKATTLGPVPTSIITLSIASFLCCEIYSPMFEKVNNALHER